MRTIFIAPALALLLVSCGSSGDDAGDTIPTVGTTAPEGEAGSASPSAPPGSTPGSSEFAARPLATATPEITEPPPTGRATTEPGAALSVPAAPSMPALPVSNVEKAVADLVAREGADPAEIAVVSEENVTWRDRSIGCPQKGFQYPQVITDGVRIVLELGGERYEYHAGGARNIFYCPDPQPPLEG